MQNVYDILKERGFIEQATHEEEIRDLLGKRICDILYRIRPYG